jgi:hypothetical protein
LTEYVGALVIAYKNKNKAAYNLTTYKEWGMKHAFYLDAAMLLLAAAPPMRPDYCTIDHLQTGFATAAVIKRFKE